MEQQTEEVEATSSAKKSIPKEPARHVWDRLMLLLATGLGVGFFPIMPGTVGSLWGPPLVWGLLAVGLPTTVYVLLCAGLILLGLPICDRAGKMIGDVDAGSIVYDEIVAFPIVFAVTPINWTSAILGFLWFRVFDIFKPWPICWFEKLPGAVGVMADDLVAAIFAAAALWATLQVFHF